MNKRTPSETVKDATARPQGCTNFKLRRLVRHYAGQGVVAEAAQT